MTKQEFDKLSEQLFGYAKINSGHFLTPMQYEELNAAYLATGEKEPLGCGVTKWWWTGIKDPFLWAACWHDLHYPDVNGIVHHRYSRQFIDDFFFMLCRTIALGRNSRWLKFKAKIYYKLVCMYKVKKWEVAK